MIIDGRNLRELTHLPVVVDAGVGGRVDHSGRRGHGQEVAAVAVAAAAASATAGTGGGVGRHSEFSYSRKKAALHHALTRIVTVPAAFAGGSRSGWVGERAAVRVYRVVAIFKHGGNLPRDL